VTEPTTLSVGLVGPARSRAPVGVSPQGHGGGKVTPMSTTSIVILVVVVVVLLLLVGAALALARRSRRKKDERRDQAQQLRQQAGQQTPGVQDALLRADEAEAEAARLRRRADEAEAEAARLRRDAAAEEAGQEDTVREADRLDPDVDHNAKAYEPSREFGQAPPADEATEEQAPPDPLEGGSERPTHAPPAPGAADPAAPAGGSHRGQPQPQEPTGSQLPSEPRITPER